jgi:hypothetical protein
MQEQTEVEVKWETVAPNTRRLEVEGGWLYRVSDDRGTQMVFVPAASAVSYDNEIYDAVQSLVLIKELLEDMTFNVATARRMSGLSAPATSEADMSRRHK